MDTLQFQYFLAIAESLSFTTAAKQFGITQPTMCRQISALEEELGTKLLLRNNHGVKFTSAGEVFLGYAQHVLSLEEKAGICAREWSHGKAGVITVSSMLSSDVALSKCLESFSQAYPNIRVNVNMFAGMGPVVSVDTPGYDFCFSMASMARNGPGICSLQTTTDRFHMAVHRKHADLIRGQDFSGLANLPFVSVLRAFSPSIFAQTINICQAINFIPQFKNLYNHVFATLIAVNAGIGITMLPYSLVNDPRMANIVSVPIEVDEAIAPFVMTWNRTISNPAASRFLEIVRTIYPDADSYQ